MYQKIVTTTFSRDSCGNRVKRSVIEWKYVGAPTENLHHLSSLDYLFKTIEDRYLDIVKLKKDIRNGAHAIKEIGQSICTLMGLALPKTK